MSRQYEDDEYTIVLPYAYSVYDSEDEDKDVILPYAYNVEVNDDIADIYEQLEASKAALRMLRKSCDRKIDKYEKDIKMLAAELSAHRKR